MKHQRILLFFALALPASLLLRILQLLFAVDPVTGFYVREYRTAGIALTLVLFAICAVLVFLCFFSFRNPATPPKKSLPLAVVSFLLAAATGFERFANASVAGTLLWQKAVLTVFAVLTVGYLIGFGVGQLASFRLPPVTALIPSGYFLIKIISTFTAVSSLSLISDNLFLLAAECTSLLFYLSFAKLYNGVNEERNFRSLLAWGLTSGVLCLSQSLAHLFLAASATVQDNHSTPAANAFFLAAGLFALIFTLTHFSRRNTEEFLHEDP
ncbi:MAG: hypothetical protein IJT66_02385 [Clostridia bacterium]|nr:hypothetical protein [Clostridia bacterium]